MLHTAPSFSAAAVIFSAVAARASERIPGLNRAHARQGSREMLGVEWYLSEQDLGRASKFTIHETRNKVEVRGEV